MRKVVSQKGPVTFSRTAGAEITLKRLLYRFDNYPLKAPSNSPELRGLSSLKTKHKTYK